MISRLLVNDIDLNSNQIIDFIENLIQNLP